MDLFFIIILVPICYIGVIYVFSYLAIWLIDFLGVTVGTYLPVVLAIIAISVIVYLIITRKDCTSKRKILVISIAAGLILLSIIFTMYHNKKTAEFRERLVGTEWKCEKAENMFVIVTTKRFFYKVKFINENKCRIKMDKLVYKGIREEYTEDAINEKRNYTVSRLINGNYIIKTGKDTFTIKARDNVPKRFYYGFNV